MKITITSSLYDCIGEMSRLVALANAYADDETFFSFTLNDEKITVIKNKKADLEQKEIDIRTYPYSTQEHIDAIAWLHAEIVEGLSACLTKEKSPESVV